MLFSAIIVGFIFISLSVGSDDIKQHRFTYTFKKVWFCCSEVGEIILAIFNPIKLNGYPLFADNIVFDLIVVFPVNHVARVFTIINKETISVLLTIYLFLRMAHAIH